MTVLDIKGLVQSKMKFVTIYLPFCLLWTTKEDILKNVTVFFLHTVKSNGVQCCFGPH